MIWLRALSFIVAVQLTVLGVVPWLLVDFGPRLPIGRWHWLGMAPLAIGALALLWCNWAFVTRRLCALLRGATAPTRVRAVIFGLLRCRAALVAALNSVVQRSLVLIVDLFGPLLTRDLSFAIYNWQIGAR